MKTRHDIWICLFLIISIFAIYWQVRHHEFVGYDDELYVSRNSQVQEGLTLKNIARSFTVITAANWHPITLLSHMTDIELYGMNSGQHHLTSVMLHIINTLLVFLVFRQMSGNIWQSSCVAVLFALHPLQVESVAQIAQRKDVVSTFFWLLTMMAYAGYVKSPSVVRYLPIVLFFILGLMAKPMLVTLPFVLLLLDYFPLNRFLTSHFSLLISEKLPLFLIAGASCVVTVIAQQSGGAVRSLETHPLGIRIANALVSYVSYIRKMFLPYDLAFFYPHPGMPETWKIVVSGLFLMFMFILSLRLLKRFPYVAVGWLWYMGTLVPVIGLVQVGGQAMADRYMYVPIIGLSVIIAWGIPDMLSAWKYKKTGLVIMSAVVVPVLMMISWKQISYWHDSITLFEHALAVTQNNDVVHNNLGIVLAEKGRFEEAITHYKKALQINPAYAKTYNNMGDALTDLDRTAEAIQYYEKALKLNPDYAKAHNNMGAALVKLGRIPEAIQHYQESLRLNPDDAMTHSNFGAALARQGKTEDAIFQYAEALRLQPDNAAAHNNMAVALFQKGNADGAIAHFQKALQINPDNRDARINLKRVLAIQQQKFNEALKQVEDALKMNPNNSELHYKLGNLYRRRGETDKAIQYYESALAIQPEFAGALNNLAILYAVKGKYDIALDLLKKNVRLQPDNADAPYHIACIYARQHKATEAVDWLKNAVEKGFKDWELIKRDNNLENIRETSYYKKLLEDKK